MAVVSSPCGRLGHANALLLLGSQVGGVGQVDGVVQQLGVPLRPRDDLVHDHRAIVLILVERGRRDAVLVDARLPRADDADVGKLLRAPRGEERGALGDVGRQALVARRVGCTGKILKVDAEIIPVSVCDGREVVLSAIGVHVGPQASLPLVFLKLCLDGSDDRVGDGELCLEPLDVAEASAVKLDARLKLSVPSAPIHRTISLSSLASLRPLLPLRPLRLLLPALALCLGLRVSGRRHWATPRRGHLSRRLALDNAAAALAGATTAAAPALARGRASRGHDVVGVLTNRTGGARGLFRRLDGRRLQDLNLHLHSGAA
eukprot:7135818-Prymnesium_polylepis.1